MPRNYSPLYQGAQDAAFSFGMAPAYRRRGAQFAAQDSAQQLAEAARAGKYEAETELLNQRRQNMQGAPQEFLSAVTGLDQNQISQLSQAMLSGWLQRDQGPPTATGQEPQINTKPAWVTPNVEQRFNTGRGALALASAATGESTADQLAKAFTQLSGNLREESALGGNTNPEALAQVMAASAGKPMRDVTNSGIDFNPFAKPGTAISTEPFDMANAMKNAAGVQEAKIRAQGGVDEAAVRENGVNSAQLALVKGYMDMGLSRDQALELANTRKAASTRDAAAEAYNKTYNQVIYGTQSKDRPNGNEELAKKQAENAANNAVDYLIRNAEKFGMGKGGKPPENKSAGYSQADLELTAKKHGLSVEEVKKRLEGK